MGENYVGQAKLLTVRIRQHLTGKYKGTADFINRLLTSDKEKITIFVVTSEYLDKTGMAQSDFFSILEQYIILIIQPCITKTFVVRKGDDISTSKSYNSIAQAHPYSAPVYFYKLKEPKSLKDTTLIHKLPAKGTLGALLGIVSGPQ